MDKNLVKTLIAERQKEISEVDLIERSIKLEESINYVFIGMRRAGKSYLLFQHIQTLIKSGKAKIEDILYVNFEDERIASITAEELDQFLECYREMHDNKPLIYLDEIQNIEGWEKFVRRLADSKYRVFVTGSNAKMLSKDIYTTLGGRFIAKEVFPFTFSEYLTYHNIIPDKNWEHNHIRTTVVRYFSDYFYFGGFAESFSLKDKRDWLNSLYHKILLGDIVARNGIRNDRAIRILVKKLAESVMQPTSLARVKNIVDSSGDSISRNTLISFLQQITDAFLIFEISNFTDSIRNRETYKKRYFFDNGLLNNFLFDSKTKLLENIVAIELKKRYGDKLYFYNRNIEVDFFIPDAGRAIQVSYSIADEFTKEREIKGLLKLSSIYRLDYPEIVTWDEEYSIAENNISINVIPIWKWLLKQQS